MNELQPTLRERDLIDGLTFHEWTSIRDLTPYMSAGWAEAFLRPNSPTGPQPPTTPLYRHPTGRQDPAARPGTAAAGTNLGLFTEQVLASGRRRRTVLGYDEPGLLATAFTNSAAANTLTQAINDWSLVEWLRPEPKLTGLILVSMNNPQRAAAEVRRLGAHPEFVGVALGTNALSMPFGHPVYHPVYEAAAEYGLPLVIQVGSDTSPSLLAPPIGGGIAATYAETEIWGAHPLMTHVATLIFEGVFELFPNLRVLLVGGGLSWLPSAIWRLDFWWSTNRLEAPLLTHLPSEYLREHVRVATYGMEHPSDPERLRVALGTVPWLEDILLYASGYPAIGWRESEQIATHLPAEWLPKITAVNAEHFFRFPAEVANTSSEALSGHSG